MVKIDVKVDDNSHDDDKDYYDDEIKGADDIQGDDDDSSTLRTPPTTTRLTPLGRALPCPALLFRRPAALPRTSATRRTDTST